MTLEASMKGPSPAKNGDTSSGFWLRLWRSTDLDGEGRNNTADPLWFAEAMDAPTGLMQVGPTSREYAVQLMRVVLATRLNDGLPMPPARAEVDRPRATGDMLSFLPMSDLPHATLLGR
jgi:hypothetical protein